jgi:hypothetical protein
MAVAVSRVVSGSLKLPALFALTRTPPTYVCNSRDGVAATDPASAAPQCPIASFAILRVGWCATSVPKALSKSLISHSSPREHQILKDQAGLPGMDLALESIRDTSDDLMVAR